MMDNPIGKVIKSYELEDLIGTGGFGAVYRAKQAVVDREVAIKIIWPAFANHPNFIRRFEAEAQLVAGLEHPYIVPLYDYWRDPDGAYIVMRLLRGGHLRGIMHERDWAVGDVEQLLGQLSAALALAHRYGVVHRDIKPENILMDEDGNAYLADFGIAQIVSNTQDDEDDLIAGMASPAYAAPEQLFGEETSSQSDIYSLGIILYELLAGEHPFPNLDEMSMSELTEFRSNTLLPDITQKRGDLPQGINEVIQRSTTIEPRQRFPDALSMARAFQNAISQGRRYTTTSISLAANEVIPNPYKGLRAFQEKDAPNFFGREALVHRLVKRMKEDSPFSRFLAVVGPSGSGKSSVVKAGLLPALRQGAIEGSDHWFFDEIVPGTQPFSELENTLVSIATTPPDFDLGEKLRSSKRGLLEAVNACLPQDSKSELLLFIDQFEEVFTLVEDETTIDSFLGNLYVAVTDPESRLRVIITIRADFYDRPLLQPGLSDLVRERTEVVVPLTPVELERVIIEPARRVGIMFDSGLVAAIIAEVKEQLGALPLLQYSLSELFERREGDLITPNAYRDLGGVRGSLARRADELYTDLNEYEQEATRQLFLRLITLGEGTEDTRRRALLTEITSLRDNDDSTDDENILRQVIDKLGKARLITFDRDPATRSPTLEVAHEAIIREWNRLREWLDESRNDVRMQRKLSALVAEWEAENTDPSLLMQGIRLDQFKEWKSETTLSLTAQEESYLQQSIAEAERRRQRELERAEREQQIEQQSRNRLRLLVIVLLIAMVVAFALTGFAVDSAQRANERTAFAESIALAASAGEAQSDNDGDLALSLALEANVNYDNPPIESRSALAEIALANGTRRIIEGHTSWVASVDISPDGQYIASGSFDSTVRLWNIQNGELIHTMTGHGGDVEAVAFSPDGKTLVSGASDFVAILWDVATGQVIRRFQGHTLPIRSIAFGSQGDYIVTGSNDEQVILWDVATGDIIRTYNRHSASVLAVAISPQGNTILSGARDGELIQWDIETGESHTLENHNSAIYDIAFSPDGRFAASCSGDGIIILWDLSTQTPTEQFVSESGDVRSVAFSPNGDFIYSGAADGVIQLWDVNTGRQIRQLRGHEDAVLGIDLDEEGLLAVSGSKDMTMRVWNVGTPGLVTNIQLHTGRVTQVQVGQDSQSVYSISVDGTLQRWNINTNTIENLLSSNTGEPLITFDINNDENRVLLGSRNGVLNEVDIATGEILHSLSGHSGNVQSVLYLSNGTQALSSDAEGNIILWNLANNQEIRRYNAHDGIVYNLALNPDETQFASAGRDTQVLLWDINTGEIVQRFEGHEDAVYAISINATGDRLISGSRDNIAIVWDMATGQDTARLIGDTEQIWSVKFAPDAHTAVIGTGDGVIILWDIDQQEALQRFEIEDVSIFALAFSPDGSFVVSGQEDGVLTAWRTFHGDEIIEWAYANRYVRPLTCIEREQYRLSPCVGQQNDVS